MVSFVRAAWVDVLQTKPAVICAARLPLGHWVTGPLGHWATGSLGHWVTGPLGHWASRYSPPHN